MSANKLTKSLFDEIKDSLNKKPENQNFKDILKFEADKTYQVRLVPNVSCGRDSIYHYFSHMWKSLATGQFIAALCPTTYGETCPIDSYVMRSYKDADASRKQQLNMVGRKENWMVNVYVISDPSKPENNGTVKVLRYGKELAKIIESAISGDDAEEFGVEKIFDIVNGCTLKIKCESRANSRDGGQKFMITYASSRFTSPSKLDGINEAKLQEIYNSIHDLKSFNPPKSQAELQQLLDQHFLMTEAPTAKKKEEVASKAIDEDEGFFKGVGKGSEIPDEKEEDEKEELSASDAKLKELLAGL